jgi:FMN-dependent NADH-azoreductase
MTTLLQIKASIFADQGQSSRLADHFVERWQAAHPDGRVRVRDLAAEPVPHITAERFSGFFADPEERTPTQVEATRLSDALIEELTEADEVVLGLPMYNFTVPSTLKAWMDHVARAGTSFRYTSDGPIGLVGDKPVHVFAARGGRYSGKDSDTQTPLLRNFLGLLGMKDLRFTYAEGLGSGGEAAEKSMNDALRHIDAAQL